MVSIDGYERCTNTFLKPAVDIQHLGPMTAKQLDRLPRQICARPMLPVFGLDGVTVIAHYCHNCDGPLHNNTRGPQIVAGYIERHIEAEKRWQEMDKT